MTQPRRQNTEEPPGVWQYQAGIGPNATSTEASLLVEGFEHSPERDQQVIDLVEAERVARNPDWVVTRLVAVDRWNVERDLLA